MFLKHILLLVLLSITSMAHAQHKAAISDIQLLHHKPQNWVRSINGDFSATGIGGTTLFHYGLAESGWFSNGVWIPVLLTQPAIIKATTPYQKHPNPRSQDLFSRGAKPLGNPANTSQQTLSPVPLPATAWIFLSTLLGFLAFKKYC